jgi:hypothetical protein
MPDYREFAKKIKEKYPDYKDVDDMTLSKKMIEKYPEYKNQVTFDAVEGEQQPKAVQPPAKKKSLESPSAWEGIMSSVVPSVKTEQQPAVSSSVKKSEAPVDLNRGTEKGEIYKGLPIKGFEDKSYVLKNVNGIDVWQEYNPKNKDVVIGKANKYLALDREGHAVSSGDFSGGEKQKNAKLALTQLAEKLGIDVSSFDGPDDIYQKIKSSKEIGETYKNITDPTRIKTLNQYFKAQASTNEGVQTYVGYPEKGKEDNEYKISKLPITKEQVWEVKRKGQKEFTVISDEGSIKSLNDWTGNNVEPSNDAKTKRDAQIARQESAANVNTFKLVNSKMFDLAEEDAVPYLQKMYSKYGFDFSESGLLGKDEVTVTSANGGKPFTVSLDNWTQGADASEAAALRKWMIENQSTDNYLDKEKEAVAQAEYEYSKATGKQGRRTAEDLSKEAFLGNLGEFTGVGYKSPEEYTKERAANTIMTNKINAQRRLSDLSNSAKTQKQKDEVATIAVANQNVLKQESDVQATYLNDLSKQNKQLNNSVFKLKQDSEKFYNTIKQQGITPEQLNTDPELLRQKQELDERAKSIESVSKNLSADMSAIESLNKENQKNAGLYIAFNENRGNVMGGLVNSVLKGVGALPDAILNNISGGDNNFASNALISLLGSDYTTEEFMKSEDRWDFTKAAFGGAESLGAMATGAGLGKIATGSAKLMAISKELPFFALSYNELKSEMRGPEWDGATTAEKEGLALIYAYINGKLEKLGTDALVDTGKIGKDVSKNLILKTIAGLKPGATTEAMDLALQTNFKKFILSSAYTLGKDFASEAKTGAMQELTGITLKNTYNLIKGKEMFKEVPNTVADITDAVISGAYMEGLGGLAFSMPKVAVDAGKFGYSKAFKDPEKLAFAEKIFNDSDMRVMILNDLKTKIASGEITKDEGQERVDAINNTVGLFEKLPEGLREEDKPKTLDLLVEKSKLEQDIKGKDEALIVPQKERITEINNELTNISKNATKEGNITESNLTERENGNEVGKTAETSGGDSTVESGENQKEVERLRTEEQEIQKPSKKIEERIAAEDKAREIELDKIAEERERARESILFPYEEIGDKKSEQEVKDEYRKAIQESDDKYDDLSLKIRNNKEEVERLRRIEQAELSEAIPNIDDYKVDGEIDKEKIKASEDGAKYQEIYDKYDRLITPLLPKVEEQPTAKTEEQPIAEAKPLVVHVEGIERGYVVPKESEGKSVGDIRTTIDSQKGNKGVIITKGTQGGVTESKTFAVAWSKVGSDNKPIRESGKNGRPGWVATSVEISEDATPQEIEKAKQAAIDKMNEVLPTIKEGNFSLKNIPATTQAKEQPSEQPTTLEEAKSIDTSDPTNLKKVQSFLDDAIAQLDAFGKETLGMNLPVAVAKVVLKTVKTLLDAGVSLTEAVKQAAKKHKVTEIDIADTIEALQNKQKESEASKAAKNISKKDNTKITVTERVALKDQLRMEAKAARESAMNIKKKQRALIDSVKAMADSGKITASQSKNLIRRLAYLNVDNVDTTQDFLDYADRLFANAEYSDKVDKAFKAKGKIKAKLKSKNQAQVTQVAKEFATIDPSLVTDIDKYNEMADAMLAAIAPSVSGVKKNEEGEYEANNKLKTPINIADVQSYVEKALEAQKEIEKQRLLSYYKELVEAGIINDKMSIEEIREVVANENNDDDKLTAKERAKIVMDDLKERFAVAKSAIEDILATDDSISESDREIIKRLMSLDITDMKIKDAMALVDAANNFIENGITAGLMGELPKHEGDAVVKKLKKSGLVAKSIGFLRGFGTKMKTIGSVYATQVLNPRMMANTLFGQDRGIEFMRLIGFDKLSSGVSKASERAKDRFKEYSKQFTKKRPNDKRFSSPFNRYERGIYASLLRSPIGTEFEQKQAFDKAVKEAIHSTEKLLESGDSAKVRKGKIYQEIIDKLGLANEDVSIKSVQSKVDPTNLEAVDFWIQTWNDYYGDLYDLSLGVYNTILDRDSNYTPTRKSKIDISVKDKDSDLLKNEGAFASFMNLGVNKNKAGVLMEKSRVLSGQNTYQDYDFDGNNKEGFEAALMDIYTAEAIRKIEGALNSDAMKSIIPVTDTRERFKEKLERYINIKKGRREPQDRDVKNLERTIAVISKFVTGRTLGTLTAMPSQFIAPAMTTLFNTGRLDFSDALNPDARAWAKKEGVSTLMRGQENFDSINRRNEQSILDAFDKNGNFDAALTAVEKYYDFWLKNFLVLADRGVANISWYSYYKQSLKRQGLSTNIDWKNHEKNDKAFAYANSMIDKNQNASDSDMQGNLYSSKKAGIRIARNIFIPYSSFTMNAKARIHTDLVNVLNYEDNGAQGIIDSVRSLVAGLLEVVTFHTVKKSIQIFVLNEIASLIFGIGDDEEDYLEMMQRIIKEGYASVIKDVFSPAPIADYYTMEGVNYYIEKSTESELAENDEKNIKDAYEKDKESRILKKDKEISYDDFKKKYIKEEVSKNKFFNPSEDQFGGVYAGGIKIQKQLADLYNLGYNKKISVKDYKGEYVGVKVVTDNVAEAGKKAFYLTLAHEAGILPGEASSISRMILKKAKKTAVTPNIKKVADDFKKDLDLKELTQYQKDMIKSGTNLDKMIENEYEIVKGGGLDTPKKQESFNKIKETFGNNIDVFLVVKDINNNKSTREIIESTKKKIFKYKGYDEKIEVREDKYKEKYKEKMIETIKNSRK